jgi:Uma2 family endonuclease
MAALLATPEEITFDEFLVRYDGCFAEWVDGRVRMEDLSDVRRSRLKGFLCALLHIWTSARNLGELYVAPLTIRLNERVALEPDLFFVRAANHERVRYNYVDGPPDLVIEIVSQGVRANEQQRVRRYESAGVSELWLVDADRRMSEVLRLDGSGRYAAVDASAALESKALGGLRVPAAWLWQEPLPRIDRVMREWGLV